MKCFIHPNKEATASCKKCGKAMCIDCSSFGGHTGVCPSCRKPELEKEAVELKGKTKALERRITKRLVLTILTFWLIFPIVLFGKFKRRIQKEIGITEERIDKITKSIGFVNTALGRGSQDLSVDSAEVEAEAIAASGSDNWQCPFCRTINSGGRTCKFCARKRPA